MSSTSDNSGSYSLTVTFAVGTDPDMAQVKVQNRVSQAEPMLPTEVVQQGVTVETESADMLGFVIVRSPDHSLDEQLMSDYTYKIIQPTIEPDSPASAAHRCMALNTACGSGLIPTASPRSASASMK